MRISVKGRYALAAMMEMARTPTADKYTTVISISDRLGISKIYLEQVFSLLKKDNLVYSVKGAQGGYHLARMPEEISVFDVLSAVESTLFEKTKETVSEKAPEIDAAMMSCVFDKLDNIVRSSLSKITIQALLSDADNRITDQAIMYYI